MKKQRFVILNLSIKLLNTFFRNLAIYLNICKYKTINIHNQKNISNGKFYLL
jgi:hypothetical protein